MEKESSYRITNIRKKLKARRLELGLKQQHVCWMANQHAGWVSKIESGYTKLSVDHLVILSIIYKVEPCYFL